MVADRGDIWHVNFDPAKGREQAGPRYALVVTPREFNQFGVVWALPITSGGNFAREKGFTVSLMGLGLKVDGVVLCNHLRAMDFRDRRASLHDKAPEVIIDEVMDKISAILE
jgi:mRNA-degrading endonuclease toxin of MazEF toxin-antitoxin module